MLNICLNLKMALTNFFFNFSGISSCNFPQNKKKINATFQPLDSSSHYSKNALLSPPDCNVICRVFQ